MKKSASVPLTIVAAFAFGAQAAPRPDPCSAWAFDEQACQQAVQNRGYCWNGRWLRMRYRQPYPYYYDSYQQYLASGGVVGPAAVGDCAPTFGRFFGGHGVSHHGFGATGSCHAAHA
jgi:hypothetical protein